MTNTQTLIERINKQQLQVQVHNVIIISYQTNYTTV